jgi:hypothetical protein
MGILTLALQISMLPIMVDGSDLLSQFTFTTKPGVGEACDQSDLVTLDYKIEDETGKRIADSERRGLSTTLEIGGRYGDPLLMAAASGARQSEERCVVLFANDWYPQADPNQKLIRTDGPLFIRIRVLHIERR